MQLTRILLVDDHRLVRECLRSVLGMYPDIEIVGEACNGEEAVQSVHKFLPNVVVMDINMPVLNGIEATRRIKAAYPRVLVVGLSLNADETHQIEMKAAGATSLLPKEMAVEQLHNAITSATT